METNEPLEESGVVLKSDSSREPELIVLPEASDTANAEEPAGIDDERLPMADEFRPEELETPVTAEEPLPPPEPDAQPLSPESHPPETPPPPPAPSQLGPRSWSWVWPSLLGAVLGGFLGLVLALLVFAGINGSVDVRRSSAFRTLNSQVNGLDVEIDTVRTDVSTLRGDLDGLRQRVEVLSGLTVRMDRAESTIETFGDDIDSLQTVVTEMNQKVDDLGLAVDTLQQQSAQTMSFFEQLRALLEEMFGGKEPQGAIPSPEGVN